MIKYTKIITVCVSPEAAKREVYAVRSDRNSRYLNIVVVDEFSHMLKISQSDSASVWCKKPDGNIVFQNCPVLEDGTIEFKLTEQILAFAGEVECEIVIYGENQSCITSSGFVLLVEEGLLDEELAESTNEFSALTDALGRVNPSVELALGAAQRAEQSADSADTAAERANSAADSADTAAERANAAANFIYNATGSDGQALQVASAAQAAVNGEITDRTAADTALQEQITANTAAIGENTADIAAHTTAIGSLEEQVEANSADIETLKTATSDGQALQVASAAQAAVNTEIANRTTADTELQEQISAHTTAIGTLEEQTAANTTAVGTLQEQTEANTTAVGTLQEQTEANTADIETLKTASDTAGQALQVASAAQAAVNGEITNRTTADTELQEQITANAAAIGSNSTAIGTNATNIAANTTAIGTLQAAAGSGDSLHLLDGVWFGKTKSTTVVPAPTSMSQKYFDFTTNKLYDTSYNLSWKQASNQPLPTPYDPREQYMIKVTSSFIDLTQDAGKSGTAYGKVNAAGTAIEWTYEPVMVQDATSSAKGVMKLYSGAGANTDGTMTQAAIALSIQTAIGQVLGGSY
jgi:hypothetical protein